MDRDLSFYLFFVALFVGLGAWILFVWLLKEPKKSQGSGVGGQGSGTESGTESSGRRSGE